MDLILRRAVLAGAESRGPLDVGIANGRIEAIAPRIDAHCGSLDIAGRCLSPGFVETHIHLDKACIADRCVSVDGTLKEAIEQVARAKAAFSVEDIHARAARTLERAILQGTTHMRTHVEVDPVVGLKGVEAVLALAREYAWAIDLDVCVFPQDGMLNLPGTEQLMIEALRRGARVLGACPYTDSDPRAQIERVFEIARDFDVDIDMHLDFSLDPAQGHAEHVCRVTERHGWSGRVAIGHVSTLSALPAEAFAAMARMLASAGVAVTVLPSTDLFLMGRGAEHSVPRGVTPVHRLAAQGVRCSLATNNVLNPFTPFGDCSLSRMANLYANIAQIGTPAGIAGCHALVTTDAARLMRIEGYGLAPGAHADLTVLDAPDVASGVAMLAPVLYGFKRGRMTFRREPARLLVP